MAMDDGWAIYFISQKRLLAIFLKVTSKAETGRRGSEREGAAQLLTIH